LLRYGLFNNFNDAGTLLLNSRVDSFFIAAVLQPLSVGIYSFYTRLSDMTQNLLPTRLFENVVQPLLFALPPTDADRRLPQYFSFLLNMNLLLQWPVLAYSIVCHAEIVQVVFGGKFAEHSALLPFIVGFAVLNTIAVPVTLVAQYEEKAGIVLLSKVFGLANVAGMLLLLPILGVPGAVIAGGTSSVIKNGFIWWHVRRRGRWINARAALLSGVATWGMAVLIGYAAKEVFGGHPAVALVVVAILMAGVLAVHVRGPAVSDSDRVILGSVLRGKEARYLQFLGLLGKGTALGRSPD
jgi:O-antigen/teichoic acid export membrane protein